MEAPYNLKSLIYPEKGKKIQLIYRNHFMNMRRIIFMLHI